MNENTKNYSKNGKDGLNIEINRSGHDMVGLADSLQNTSCTEPSICGRNILEK